MCVARPNDNHLAATYLGREPLHGLNMQLTKASEV